MGSFRLISIVDDDQALRTALRRLIDSAGFRVETFDSGLQFLQSLQQQHPDCVVLDVDLPVVSGLEIQRQLSRQQFRVPSIMITGRDEPGLDERARAAGATGFLRKPFDKQVLLDTIATVIRGAQGSKPGRPQPH